MSMVWVLISLSMVLALLAQFARQEHFQDGYETIVFDVEARLDWARTRSTYPFGMQAQLEVSQTLLMQAKHLWGAKRWGYAYEIVLQSQQAMDKAQQIYSAGLSPRNRINTAGPEHA